MPRLALLAAAATLAVTSASSVFADEATSDLGSDMTIEQAASMLHYVGGNDKVRAEFSPSYSKQLGLSLKGAVGGYITDEVALGLIVEYGENKREYLANAGIQFNDALSLVGTVGLLEEKNEYVDAEGRELVQQMEYGASLKGEYEVGFLSGFELNGYSSNANADSDNIETGKLYGVQLLADVDLTDATHVKIGGGYEWLEWKDSNEDDNRWTFSAEGAQQLGDALTLTGNVKLGASEYTYGGGLAFDLSNGGLNTNTLGVNYTYIQGRNGIDDDQRVELSWSIGFGAGPTTSVAAADLTDESGTIRAAADGAMVSPANNLLSDVMKRPEFLPDRVLARSSGSSAGTICDSTSITITAIYNVGAGYYDSVQFYGSDFVGGAADALALFPSDGSIANNPAGIEVYVTPAGSSSEARYTKPFTVYGDAGASVVGEYALYFDGSLGAQVKDSNAFSTGDTLRLVFRTGGTCYEVTSVVPPPES